MIVLIKIMIADDQALFLDMLCTIITSYGGYDIIARASDGQQAIDLYQKHRPDICLLDIQMPKVNGIDALKRIKQYDPNAKVIMLTTFGDDENILDAYRAYADGYILKDIKPAELINAMGCVYAGLVCMNKSVMGIVNNHISELRNTVSKSPNYNTDVSFNPKDIEIIRLIGAGLSNKLIAETLNYSEGTIRNRISAILSDMGLKDRTQLALFAIKNKLI